MDFNLTNDTLFVHEKTNYSTLGAGLRWSGDITSRWSSEFILGYSDTRTVYDHFNLEETEFKRRWFTIVDSIEKMYFIKSGLVDVSGSLNNHILLQKIIPLKPDFRSILLYPITLRIFH
ncbi:MAG: hypothetical protein HC906_18465 [Bacteroidales bacterium]|nr:hypothetical protein [Bacteroidales bacterium]